MKTADDLIRIKKRCLCCVKCSPLVYNRFLQINGDIMAQSLMANGRSGTQIFLHPGTDHLFLQAVVYALIAGYLTCDFQAEDYAEQFLKGDMVVLDGRTRCEFVGIDREKGYYLLEENGLTSFIPLSHIYRIKLYEGTATTMGTRGIRKSVKKAEKFLEDWFGTENTFAPRTQPHSVLIVCNREKAEKIIETTTFRCEEHEALFCELFPSAWFSNADSWSNFPGNSGRSKPVVMFTNRVSTARDLVYYDCEKRIRSVIVNGIENISSSPHELEDIMKQNSIHNTILLAETSHGLLPEFQMNNTPSSLVFWSGQALLSLLDDLCNESQPDNPMDISLKKAIDNEIERETIYRKVLLPFDFGKLDVCRELLKRLCRLPTEDSDIKRFLISAFGLLKLYEQSCFPLSYYEKAIESGIVSARLPSEELTKIIEIYASKKVESELADTMGVIVGNLKDIYCSLYKKNPKLEELLSLLFDKNRKYAKKAVVVPKESYALTLNAYMKDNSIQIQTSGSFKNDVFFDCIVASGVFTGKRYDPFKSNNAPQTIVLGYETEKPRFDWLKNEFLKLSAKYEMRNILSYERETIENNGLQKTTDGMIELEKQISEIFIDVLEKGSNEAKGKNTAVLKAIRSVVFENGEWALLTEHYSPYVFDENRGRIEDGEVDKLSEGDLLIFAVRNDIVDFVDIIMDKIIPSTESSFQEYYRKSRRWKTVLCNYMKKNNANYADIAQKMKDLGHPRHQNTIRSWLSEDSRIVGPRDENSYIVIALLTEDKEMTESPEAYCRACDEIRSMRIRILHYIENQIVRSYIGDTEKSKDLSLSSLIGDAGQYARGLRISSVTPVNREVPASFANRPHEL